MVNFFSKRKLTKFIALRLVVIILVLSLLYTLIGVYIYLQYKTTLLALPDINQIITLAVLSYLVLIVFAVVVSISLSKNLAKNITAPFIELKKTVEDADDYASLDLSDEQPNILVDKLKSMLIELESYKVKVSEMDKQKQSELDKAVEKVKDEMRLESMDKTRLSNSLSVILKQLREKEDLLRAKQRELVKSNEQLAEAQENLKRFNEELEKKVKERTSELEEANIHIQKLLDAKSLFVNQVSHDLRTPLTPILTLLPLVKKEMIEKGDPEEILEMLQKVMNNVDYLSNIVTSTLSISRLDTGKTKLQMKAEDIYDIFEEVITSNEIILSNSRVHILNYTKKGLPKVYVDRMRVREVLNNLISNSIKFMENSTKELTFDASPQGRFMTVMIKDTGIGINKKNLDKIFEEFFKADPSRHTHSSGLGLSICRRIIEKHGGKIWAESKGKDKGTVFKFTVQLYKT